MNVIQKALTINEVLVLDGAMGTMLFALGLEQGGGT